jgi:hypothetical protein
VSPYPFIPGLISETEMVGTAPALLLTKTRNAIIVKLYKNFNIVLIEISMQPYLTFDKTT